jgi:rubrerythrin
MKMRKIEMQNPELASIEVEEVSRGALLMKGALAAGAIYGAVAVGPLVGRALGRGSGGDVEIVNYALTLEYLEAAFYQEAAKQVKGLSNEVAGFVKTFGDEEQQHVDALASTVKDLGGKPVAAPKVDFGDAFSSAGTFLKLAQTLEDTGVSAYNGAAPMIRSADVLAAAGSIVQIEARHAAVIRVQNGEPPAPAAFDETLTMDQVLKAVEPFLAS